MADVPALFEGRNIRKVWFADEWWFAVVDVIAVLTESADPTAYWRKLKQRLRTENAETVTNCHALRLPTKDGKFRALDCANTEILLRIIQSVPSPNAEPFKLWLAQVGSDRIDEAGDPEAAYIEWRKRAILSYQAAGYSEDWAIARVDNIVSRNDLTSEWTLRSITSEEIPILTNELHMGTFGISVQEHMGVKGLTVIQVKGRPKHKGNLQDGMTRMELALSTFANNLTSAIHEERGSEGYAAVHQDVVDAGQLSGSFRQQIEAKIGKPVVSSRNMAIEKDGGLWGQIDDSTEAESS
jgi:DNA-damage-inducible protein D